MDDYVHRIGRTGRAGHRGLAIGFINERCRYCNELADLLRGANQEVPDWLSQVAKANQSSYEGRKGKGKGGNSELKDFREIEKKKVEAAAAKSAAAKAPAPAPTPAPPKEPERPKTPPREVPDA